MNESIVLVFLYHFFCFVKTFMHIIANPLASWVHLWVGVLILQVITIESLFLISHPALRYFQVDGGFDAFP